MNEVYVVTITDTNYQDTETLIFASHPRAIHAALQEMDHHVERYWHEDDVQTWRRAKQDELTDYFELEELYNETERSHNKAWLITLERKDVK